ncbi:alpha/beta fold hydrolase [Mycolicibacterium peregrinum]|uniref:Bromoperoxidase n=1 Tax=Mycolicibacterium peregrinum TaxID=43304 RepID=A0A1A0WCD6_MYCPR|nr:alpha/beta hydrolase [Mycolicibacterium peregrinum]OBB94958.1 bromoperoxidase [Mycolicibacterium peregrinum]OBF44638.1 bromoperoxidase [Mycolicibacterium peregrinum]
MTAITAYRGLLRSIDLHVEDTGGDGRPVVLIHGWPLTGESWAPQVEALTAAGYRVITYDRRGFGRSDTSLVGYTYESLSDDLSALMEEMDLHDATLVGFSMGGGEVASYCARKGTARVRSAVFASSVTPCMLHSRDNPAGPLGKAEAAQMAMSLTKNQDGFYDQLMTDVFSVNGELVISEDRRRETLAMCGQANKHAALACLTAFGNTDFREDLPRVTVPSLVIHGDADTTVPFEGSGLRTHEALRDSRLHVIAGGPHGIPISHAGEFNDVLLAFLAEEFGAHRGAH